MLLLRHCAIIGLALLGLMLSARASDSHAADLRAVAGRIVGEVIVPRYRALADATAAQRRAWERFCTAPAEVGVADLRKAYQLAADAWSSIEFLHYGPIGEAFRSERMAHWPERRNAVDRALAALLAREDIAGMTAEQFAGTSVAGQGLSAMERLLYADDGSSMLFAPPGIGRTCPAGRLIATSLAAISVDVLDAWTRPDGTAAQLAQASDDEIRTAVTRFATDMLSIYQVVGDLKIDAIMGRDLGHARPALAEGRRGQRSSRALVLNLKAAEAMTRLMVDPARPPGRQIVDAIKQAVAVAAALPPDFAPLAADATRRRDIVLLRNAVRSSRDLSDALSEQLGITLGFNSLDGD